MHYCSRLGKAGVLSVFVVAAFQSTLCQAQPLQYTGVNLAGAEFGTVGRPLPGSFDDYDYTYPTSAEVDYYVGKGMNTFRLPFRWERLQPDQDSALNSDELARMDAFVNYATSQGAHVILDPHNYGRYYPLNNTYSQMQSGDQGVIGGEASVGEVPVPYSSFADFWGRVANQYKNNDKVIFGLMNEPNSMETELWTGAANAAITAIRSAGAENLILVPGNGYTGAHSWMQDWYGTPNASAMLNIYDPLDNYAFDIHQYLDNDSSGQSSFIVSEDIGVERLEEVTQWLKDNGLQGFLGEFAVANSQIGDGIGDEALHNMLDYMEANPDAWLGWAWWGGGPWWGEYIFALDPADLGAPVPTDREAMTALESHLAPEPASLALLSLGAVALLRRRS